jgi:alpha-L-rhamnosidase
MGLLQQEEFTAQWICPREETEKTEEENVSTGNSMAEKMAYIASLPPEERETAIAKMMSGGQQEPQKEEVVQKEELRHPAAYFKKTFSVADVQDSRLYISALGLYEASINGKRVGDFVLAPGCFAYDKHVAYQTYDVTELLQPGENELTVILGDGWYRSASGVDGDRNIYGDKTALYFQLEQEGRLLCGSDESVQVSVQGALRENDMQQGEIVDARMEEPMGYEQAQRYTEQVQPFFAPNAVPVKEQERFEGKLLITPNGERVLDFGQNLAGYVEFTLRAHAGDTITLTHGETLDEHGNFTQENFQDRQRHKEGGIRQQVVYTCKEGENHYKTRFSIWGFRYAKVETDIDLTDAAFTAIAVYSDMAETGKFTCDHAEINQLFENCLWSMKSNFCDVPTDCPTRERAAWTGDMGVFVETALDLMDSGTVIRKWLQECRLAQYPDGKIANIAPRNNNPSYFSGILAGSVGWGDACILVPYALYRRTGDTTVLEENYDMMKQWYGFLESRAAQSPENAGENPYEAYTINTGVDYGEWCEPDVVSTDAMRTPQGKVATAYYAYSGKLLGDIAELLGKREDAARFREIAAGAREASRHMATENGRIHSLRQAEYIRAITFDLLSAEEKKQAAADLDQLVAQCGYKLNTGFLSTPDLCRVLAEYGYEDTAYRVLLNEEMPGWLYEVKKGATTIWEVWDGIDEKGVPKESLNHYSKGAIAGWLMDGVCGIHTQGGEITLTPHPNQALSFAEASYDSLYGSIYSQWQWEGDQVTYTFRLPANTRAKVILPDGRTLELEPGETTL